MPTGMLLPVSPTVLVAVAVIDPVKVVVAAPVANVTGLPFPGSA